MKLNGPCIRSSHPGPTVRCASEKEIAGSIGRGRAGTSKRGDAGRLPMGTQLCCLPAQRWFWKDDFRMFCRVDLRCRGICINPHHASSAREKVSVVSWFRSKVRCERDP